ncbi:hypothetical protein BDV93DRAFT_517385 [Ceratobasidium sp. AG-I]|nr:hypothetical protein BDV93DRAFT_517385 [Ceratobasidium sp. AG-I]
MLTQISRTTLRVSQIQSRSLASTVLLPKTSEQWQERTVAELRNEAKRRGLSSGGNKSKLIDRLVVHAQSNDRPTAPSGNASPQAVSIRQRWISSGSSLQAEADKFKARWSRNLDVKLPETPDAVDEGPVIPFLAQKFDSPASESASPPQELPSSAPKVVTVASAATHIGGGPSHAIHESSDAHAIEQNTSKGSKKGTSSAGIGALLSELGIPLSFDFKQPGRVVGEILEPMAAVSLPKIEEDASNAKDAQRELNPEEQKGLWVLGGIVAGGLLLGGFGNKRSPSKKEKH